MGPQEYISILELLTALGEEKKLIFGVTALGAAIMVAVALLLPRQFVASTVVLPPQHNQGSAAGMLAQLGGLVGLAGDVGGKSPDEMYVAFLQTRRIQDGLIRAFGLEARYGSSTIELARMALDNRSEIMADKKSGLISITVSDQDAAMAAKIANGYVDELRKLLAVLAVTEVQQRRAFFEQQVNKTKEALNLAEVAFRKERARSGWSVTQVLAESGTRTAVELRARIAQREVQAQSMQRFATGNNPDMQRIAAEILALKAQLAKIESGSGGSAEGGDLVHGQSAIRAYRDMKVLEATLEALVRQLEVAKVDEAREGPLLQQLDVATPPSQPALPKRTSMVILGTSLSAVLGVLLAAMVAGVKRAPSEVKQRLARLRSVWLF